MHFAPVTAWMVALGGTGISKSEVSRICAGLDESVGAFRTRRLDHARFPYVYLDATYLHVRTEAAMVVSKAVVIATGVTEHGRREILGLDVGDSWGYLPLAGADEVFWRAFLTGLRKRGLGGVQLVISDQHAGLVAAVFRTIFAQPDLASMAKQPDLVRDDLASRYPKTGPLMDDAKSEVLAFATFPREHWRKIWSSNPLERLNKEIKRRSRVVGIFLGVAAVIRLIGAVLTDTHDEWQVDERRYLSEGSMAKLYPTSDTETVALPEGDR